uniref:cellulase n=1 Tax=Sipyloidea sipylus TaxID=202427 RepID=A0A125SL08_SIPSI|nr:glycoside hydrolase family 9 [Sipyloidea sipylus]
MRCLVPAAVLLLSCVVLQATAATYDYKLLLQKSLLFYEAQRSGKLPSDQKVTWRHDSALNDKGQNGEDLTGGYYDAGDYVKFGFPMAFSTTLLAWSVLDHSAAYESANALEDGRKAVKWATDYFIKCHVSEFEFYGQVGQGQLDHDFWTQPEDMTEERTPYKITATSPGSDLAAETAAAMAASYMVFKSVNATYATILLTHAEQLMNFAVTYQGKYSDSITDAKNFYASSGYIDELVWGAAWLYRATQKQTYLDIVDKYWSQVMYNDGFGWDSKKSGADSIMYLVTKEDKYKERLKIYCDYCFNNVQKTPKGLIFLGEWGSLRNNANLLLICSEAAKMGIETDTYRPIIKNQIGYYVGDTGFSYVVGYGSNYPKNAHHRSSSCPDHPQTCGWDFFNSDTPNHHVLEGALVGGPSSTDAYTDTRKDAQHNEVACDYNAAFQGVIANLVELYS